MKQLKPIRIEKDYEAALAEVEILWGSKNGSAKGDRLNVLATLFDFRKSANCPMDQPRPIEAIKFRMVQQGLTRKDLQGIIGSRARIAEILDRKRGLSIAIIRRLNAELNISAGVLIRPTREKAA